MGFTWFMKQCEAIEIAIDPIGFRSMNLVRYI